MRLFSLILLLMLSGCTGIPEGITPVTGFDKQRYLGTWYEIARLDHSFERGLEQVTAQYSLREDGGIKVVNRGYHTEKAEWNEAEGKAYFVSDTDVGHLKVSFFGPFYASYVVMALDPEYQWAIVTGPNRDYLWFLTREPKPSDTLIARMTQIAKDADFPVDALIYVNQI